MAPLGNPAVDYIVADATALPGPVAHSQHASRAIRLPGCFFPNSQVRARGAMAGQCVACAHHEAVLETHAEVGGGGRRTLGGGPWSAAIPPSSPRASPASTSPRTLKRALRPFAAGPPPPRGPAPLWPRPVPRHQPPRARPPLPRPTFGSRREEPRRRWYPPIHRSSWQHFGGGRRCSVGVGRALGCCVCVCVLQQASEGTADSHALAAACTTQRCCAASHV